MKQKLLPACLAALARVAAAQTPAPFDIAINEARVIDPESKLDAIRHVGIRGAKITAVSATPLTAKRTIVLHWHRRDAELARRIARQAGR